MAKITALKREVECIQRALNMQKGSISVVWHLHREGEPHGCMGSVRMILSKNGEGTVFEPLSYEEEMACYTIEEYQEMVEKCPHMKTTPNHVYSTYEKWLESHRCKCGHHGEDGRQPFYGVATLLKEYEALPPEEKASQTAETLEAYGSGELSGKQQISSANSEESAGDSIVECCSLPQTVILDRKLGFRRFSAEDLDRICKEQYGEAYAKYDPEKDCCTVTVERVKPKQVDVDLVKVGGY